jgi:hypothetical protein
MANPLFTGLPAMMQNLPFVKHCRWQETRYKIAVVLTYSFASLAISFALMWYAIRTAVTNPVLRPRIAATQTRLGLLNVARVLTTLLAVAGVWYSVGWIEGILTYIATEVVRAKLLKRYTEISVQGLTAELLRWQQETLSQMAPEEAFAIARQSAAETVSAWIDGKEF